MSAPSLDQILRGLAPGSEVQLNLRSVPIDELLMTLHETRFGGELCIGSGAETERVFFREGKVVDVEPCRYLHVQLLARLLLEMSLITGKALRDLIEDDANMSGADLGLRLLARSLVSREDLARVWTEQARRRLFYLYDHPELVAKVLRTEEWSAPLDLQLGAIDVLPAVAYGLVMRSDDPRRRAILAFVAHKHVELVSPYDEERNRCGLPQPLLDGARVLAGGLDFGGEPCIPDQSPETTGGLLLLFQRMALLVCTEHTHSSHPPRSSLHSSVA